MSQCRFESECFVSFCFLWSPRKTPRFVHDTIPASPTPIASHRSLIVYNTVYIGAVSTLYYILYGGVTYIILILGTSHDICHMVTNLPLPPLHFLLLLAALLHELPQPLLSHPMFSRCVTA